MTTTPPRALAKMRHNNAPRPALDQPLTDREKLRKVCESILHLDKTPAYSYDLGRTNHLDRDGIAPDSGRWYTPREIAQNMLRRLDAEDRGE